MEWQEWLQQTDYFEGLKAAAESLNGVIDERFAGKRAYAQREKSQRWIKLIDPLPGVRLLDAHVPYTGSGPATLHLNVWIYDEPKFEEALQRFKAAPRFTSGRHVFGITRGYRNSSYERSPSLKGIRIHGFNHVLRLDEKFSPDTQGLEVIARLLQDFYRYVHGLALDEQAAPAPLESKDDGATATQNGATRRYADSAGTLIPARMQIFFNHLEDLGFEVALTKVRKANSVSKTFHVSWSGICIGQWVLGMLQERDPRVMLHRFQKQGLKTIAEAPPLLTEELFAQQHGVDVRQVVLFPSEGKHYLHVRDETTALVLLRQWAEQIDAVLAPPVRGSVREMLADIAQVEADPTLTPTQRQALVEARIGQGRFRGDLMHEFSGSCAVSGMDVPEALRASHIVPWRTASNAERLDPKNGLLMSANLDALFDRYLITFDCNGRLLASPSLSGTQRTLLALGGGLSTPPCARRQAFLSRHEAEFARRVAAEGP